MSASSKFKPFYRMFSVLLSLVIVFNLVGASMADAAAPVEKKVSLKPAIGEVPNKFPKTKLELPSKRTPYSTRFLNPDGSFTEEIYLEPKFYQDPADQSWKTIDNSLKTSATKSGHFENTANDMKTFFNDQAGSGKHLCIRKKRGKTKLHFY